MLQYGFNFNHFCIPSADFAIGPLINWNSHLNLKKFEFSWDFSLDLVHFRYKFMCMLLIVNKLVRLFFPSHCKVELNSLNTITNLKPQRLGMTEFYYLKFQHVTISGLSRLSQKKKKKKKKNMKKLCIF